MKSIGALPTTVNPADGSPRYTIPAIFDDSTGVAIADSALIAEYLDKTYPDTPALIPKGTCAFQSAFQELFYSKVLPIWILTVPDVPESLNPRSAEYFRKHRAIDFGVPSLDVMRVSGQAKEEQLKKAKGVLGDFDKVMKDGDTWVMGDKPTFVDFVIASVILSVKIVCGKKSEEYREFMSWHGGRWSRMMTILEEKYSTVEL
ncbi:hypothetical protein D9757_005051 [Collybiopsis confluens]|uniref:GST N-terminal domain-containing protein n=1 Tax=Collybiopsis confluens TaxID=2823264 RepID=A0A8H5MBZ3_9AGAR|nr:hypothetical protein D9757_005051 [Collybiopsis confluens]